MSSTPPTHSAQSITPRWAEGMISPPGMLTTVKPSACHTSPAMPVWRHFMPFMSSTVWIGFLNQPNAWGPDGRIGNTTTLSLSSFW